MKTNTLTKRRKLSQYRREKIESWFKFTSPCFWPLDEYRLFIIFPVVHEMMRRVPLHGSPIYKESQVDPDFWHGFRIGLAKVFHMSRDGNLRFCSPSHVFLGVGRVSAVFCRHWCTTYGVYHCIDLNSSLLINNDTKRRLIAKWQHNWFHKSKPANHMIPVRIVGGGRYCW